MLDKFLISDVRKILLQIEQQIEDPLPQSLGDQRTVIKWLLKDKDTIEQFKSYPGEDFLKLSENDRDIWLIEIPEIEEKLEVKIHECNERIENQIFLLSRKGKPESELWLERWYPRIYKAIDELMSKGIIESCAGKYNWKLSQAVLARLFKSNYGRVLSEPRSKFPSKIAEYFLLNGRQINFKSFKSEFGKDSVPEDWEKIEEIINDIILEIDDDF